MAFISACKSWMFKERKNLYFLICCQGILVAFEFAMDFKVDTLSVYADKKCLLDTLQNPDGFFIK
jgi:hypothetical protein